VILQKHFVAAFAAFPPAIPLPAEIGLRALTLEGKPVEAPIWDAQGFLWLKRDGSTEEADKDFLALKQFSVLEDGIAMPAATALTYTGKQAINIPGRGMSVNISGGPADGVGPISPIVFSSFDISR